MIKIGYMRISKSDGSQTFDMQMDAMKAEGVDFDRIYSDKISSRSDSKPGLEACLKALQPGNTLVVYKLDRLARTLKELVNIVSDLQKRGIGFKLLAGMGKDIDTSTPTGRLMFGIFGILAEFEHDLILERVNAGVKAARARGRLGGRPRKMDKNTLKIIQIAMSDKNCVVYQLAKKMGMSPATIYSYVDAYGVLKPKGVELMEGRTKKELCASSAIK